MTLKNNYGGNVLGEQDIVNVFAEYFHSVYLKDNDFLPHVDKCSNVLLSILKLMLLKLIAVCEHYQVNTLEALIIYLIF